MTLRGATEAFLEELRVRDLSRSSQNGYRSMFRSLLAFAGGRGLLALDAVEAVDLREWLNGRGLKASSRRTEVARMRAFFSHACAEGWIDASPAASIRAPKASSAPTMPLERDEVRRLLEVAREGTPERALVLLLRWSGLAIGDAVTLRRSDLEAGGELVLRRAKTGEVVTVQLPDLVVEALLGLRERPGGHFFWTGRGRRDTCAKYWRSRLKGLAGRAGLRGFRPHRLRDTFAVELLLADVAIQDVSVLLGHSSVRTTELYYAPWNGARRRRLKGIVEGAHREDPILTELAHGKGRGAAGNSPRGGKLGAPQANRTAP